MNLLDDFFKTTDNQNIINAKSTITYFYNTNKKFIQKYLIEDFEQDIILIILESLQKYDESKGSFSTMLNWEFKSYKQNIITKNTGIKINYRLCKEICKNGVNHISLHSYENL